MKGPRGNFFAKPMTSAEKKQNQKEFIKTMKPFYKSIIAAINGETKCKSEDIREIAFYKTGVTL